LKYFSLKRYKNLVAFFTGRFEKRHQNLTIFAEIPTNLHIASRKKNTDTACQPVDWAMGSETF